MTEWPTAKTADGVVIVPGLRVWNNDLRAGTVTDRQPHMERNYNPGNGPVFPAEGSLTPWFHVEVDDRGVDDFDGSRLTTVHPFTRKHA
jgi:hypothetical protein